MNIDLFFVGQKDPFASVGFSAQYLSKYGKDKKQLVQKIAKQYAAINKQSVIATSEEIKVLATI